jgi:hypothetical protein
MTTPAIRADFWEYMTALKGEDPVFRNSVLAALDATAPKPETEFRVVPIREPDIGWSFEFFDADGVFLTIFIPQSESANIKVTWSKP